MTLEGEREARRCSPRRRLLVLCEPAAKKKGGGACLTLRQLRRTLPPFLRVTLRLSGSLSVSFVCVQKPLDVSFISGLSSPAIQLFQRFEASP